MGYPPERIARIVVEGMFAEAIGALHRVQDVIAARDIATTAGAAASPSRSRPRGTTWSRPCAASTRATIRSRSTLADLGERIDVVERDVERLFKLARDLGGSR